MIYKYIVYAILLFTVTSFPQKNLEKALMKGGWTGGLAGWIGWENFKTTEKIYDVDYNSKIDGYNFIISSRNGSFVENNGVFGFDFQWRQKDRTITPDPNPNNENESLNESIWFLGLWARYYLPLEGEFAMFIEGSAGYADFNQENYYDGPGETAPETTNSSANGFAYNAGAGFSLFVSPNAAFEITGRWEGGKLTGDTQVQSEAPNSLTVKLGNIFILFGFQIYLR